MHNTKRLSVFLLIFVVNALFLSFLIDNNILPTKNLVPYTRALAIDAGYSMDAEDQLVIQTQRAEFLARKINSPWTISFFKNSYKKELESALAQRREFAKRAFLGGLSYDDLPKLSPQVASSVTDASLIESSVYIEDGSIRTLISEDFENKNFSYQYLVSNGNELYSLKPPEDIGYVSGEVDVYGVSFGTEIYVDSGGLLVDENSVEEHALESDSESNVLVLLINFKDTQEVPFSRQGAHDIIFNGQFNKFMEEQSYGKANFTGDVYGWLTLNYNSFGQCSVQQSKTAIDNYVTQNNIDIRNYDHLLYVFNCFGYDVEPGGVSSVGKNNVILGGIKGYTSETIIAFSLVSALAPSRWAQGNPPPFSWTNFDFLLSHELGHALGLWHANGLDCDDRQIDPPCIQREYENSFDAMGNGASLGLHYNAYYKDALGWIYPNHVINITEPGTYKISSLDSGGDITNKKIAPKVVYITPPGQTRPVYVLEYRSGVGFDKNKTKRGIYINKINITGNCPVFPCSTKSNTALIDARPTTLLWLEDVKDPILGGREIFEDKQYGIKIKPSPYVDTSNEPTFEVIF